MSRLKIDARRMTIAATFGAIYAVLRAIPTFRMVGIQGASFSAGDLALTTFAILLDPGAAVLAVSVGTFIGFTFRPPVFLGLDFVPAAVHVVVVGLAVRNKRLAATGVFAAALLIYVIHPYSLLFAYPGIPFFWLHLVALLLLASPAGAKLASVSSSNYGLTSLALRVALYSLIGTMSQHITGAVVFETIVGALAHQNPAAFSNIWLAIFWVYPVERGMIVLISTILGTAIIRSLRHSRYWV